MDEKAMMQEGKLYIVKEWLTVTAGRVELHE